MGPKRISKEQKSSLGLWVKSDFESSFSTSRRVIDCSTTSLNTSDLLYPKTSSQLVVQKKKIEELKTWLETALKSKTKAPILLLKGPSGSGKTVTLELLAKELNAEACSWEEPLRAFSAQEWEYRQYKNPMQHLEDFLKKHNKYCKLPISFKNSPEEKLTKKLILIKNVYSVVHKNLDMWYRLLAQHHNHGSVPLVVIWTEEKNDFHHLSQVFPSDIQHGTQLTTIQFNRVADTFVLKALQFATSGLSQFPKTCLQEIVDSCNGDLQFAYNTLKLVMKGVGKSDISTHSRTGVKRSREKAVSATSRFSSKDHSCEFMHLLGKILYAKRVDSDEPTMLASHLQHEVRQPLKDNPFGLVDQLNQPASKVSLYLHQNCCNTFSCIEDISKAAHYLSSADVLSSHSPEHDKLDEFSLLVAILGTMHSHVSSKPSSWLPLKKPEFYSLEERKNEFKLSMMKVQPLENDYAVEIFPYFQLISSVDIGVRTDSTKRRSTATSSLPCKNYTAHGRKINADPAIEKITPHQDFENEDIVIEEFDD